MWNKHTANNVEHLLTYTEGYKIQIISQLLRRHRATSDPSPVVYNGFLGKPDAPDVAYLWTPNIRDVDIRFVTLFNGTHSCTMKLYPLDVHEINAVRYALVLNDCENMMETLCVK